jgi:hypothetical protein
MKPHRVLPSIALGLLLGLAPMDAGAQPAPQPDASATELERARLEVEKARLEADKAKAEAEKARAEADAAKAEAEANDTSKIAKNNNFTINPLGLIFGGIAVGYDRGLADIITLGVRLIYLAPLMPFIHFHGVGGEFSLLFWPRHPNNGFFVGPFLQVTKTFPTDSDYIGVTVVAPGAKLGWRWIWDNGFNLGLGAGFGWGFAVAQDKACPSNAICFGAGGGPAPLLLLDLGYAF